jgi:hypothetical protein
MKKLLTMLAFSAILIACAETNADGSIKLDEGIDNPSTRVIDSCEYIVWGHGLAHKGNCKFCAERRRNELKKIIEENQTRTWVE